VPDGNDAATVDAIRQSWTSEEGREEWSNGICNFAILSLTASPHGGRARKKGSGSSSSWERMLKRYKREPWPLTRQLSELDGWGDDAVRDQQRDVLS